MYRTPVDLYLDEWVHDFLDTLQRTGATRVAIDSLGDLRAACRDELRFREYIYSLLQRCARANISVMMTQEVPELFGVTRLSEYGISHLSDNVLLLQFLRGDSELKRAITVHENPWQHPRSGPAAIRHHPRRRRPRRTIRPRAKPALTTRAWDDSRWGAG